MADNAATQRRAADDLVVGSAGYAYSIKNLTATYNQAAASANDTITFGRIPSNARILANSEYANDDLASAGAPTLDIGLFAVKNNITSDDDALNDGIDLANAGSGKVVKDHANYGKRAWEFVNGQTSDPGGEFIVRGTIKDAATNVTGDVTLEINYVVD